MKNPWMGLSSYTEESLKEYKFYGRSKAIAVLASMIRRNLFVTLYGRSGIGKTSLLQAGVFPVLRKEGMYPVLIRLDNYKECDDNGLKKNEETFQLSEIVWNKIIEDLKELGVSYIKYDAHENTEYDFKDNLVLRKLFSSGRFLDKEGKGIIPVMVMDQFEEILYNAPRSSKLLLSQLYALVDDSYDLRINHPLWHDQKNFRIVISLREDTLFMFEDLIDSFNYVELKNNRYRLLPLTEEEASEVILGPNLDIWKEEDKVKILKRIIKISKDRGDSVNTVMLSLLCYVLFNDSIRNNKKIALSDLNKYDDIIKTYYLEVVKSLPSKKERYYLEDNLIDEQGRRKSIYETEFVRHAPHASLLFKDGNNRILNCNKGRIELIHDQLALVVLQLRNTRNKTSYRNLLVISLFLVLLFIFIFSTSKYSYQYDPTVEWSSNDLTIMQDNVNLVEYNISNDYFGDNGQRYGYLIEDCPNLKTLNIYNDNAIISIHDCPSLVNINYSENFSGKIYVRNCPNIIENNDTIEEASIFFNHTATTTTTISGSDYLDTNQNKLIIFYPNLRTKMNMNGVKISGYHQNGILQDLDDSLKRTIDCYIPFGTKNSFSQLRDFQSFRSLNELPLYYTYVNKFNTTNVFYKNTSEIPIQNIFIFVVILIVYTLISLKFYYKRGAKNRYFKSFLYGLTVALIFILSYSSTLSLIYTIIVPYNWSLAHSMGIIVSIICLVLISSNALYYLNKYLQTIRAGKNSILLLFRKYVKGRKFLFLSLLLLICLIFGLCKCYGNGVDKRKKLLVELYEMPNVEISKSLAKDLLNSRINIFYPSFKDKLKTIINQPNSLLYSISPKYVFKIANENNIKIDKMTKVVFLDISNDGSKLLIKFDYTDDRVYQPLLLDLTTNKVIELFDRISYDELHQIKFSPNSEDVFIARNGSLINYSISDKFTSSYNFVPNSQIDNLNFNNDSLFLFSSGDDKLYRGIVNNKSSISILDPNFVNLSNVLSNDNLICGNTGSYLYGLLVYDINKKIIIDSVDNEVGSTILITEDRIYTYNGFYDLNNKSFKYKHWGSTELFNFDGNVFKIINDQSLEKIYIKDLSDNIIQSLDFPIGTTSPLSYRYKMSNKNGYLIGYSYNFLGGNWFVFKLN